MEFGEHLQGGAVTIGNFDGVHRGHQRIVHRLREHADQVSGPAVALTFQPHPAHFLRPDAVPVPLTSFDRRVELLNECGVDHVVLFPTSRELLASTPRQFFDQIVLEGLHAQAIVEGPNFRFGKDRQGDVTLLADLCRESAIALEIVTPLHATPVPAMRATPETDDSDGEGAVVSSTAIRQCIAAGDVERAAAMLGRPHAVSGTVSHGAQRGRLLGFPTANLTAVDAVLPAPGVYAGSVVHEGCHYLAAVHVGPLPTFNQKEAVCEVHLLDYRGDLYGRSLRVAFHQQIRGVVKFDSTDLLRTQLERDVATVRQRGMGDLFTTPVKRDN